MKGGNGGYRYRGFSGVERNNSSGGKKRKGEAASKIDLSKQQKNYYYYNKKNSKLQRMLKGKTKRHTTTSRGFPTK